MRLWKRDVGVMVDVDVFGCVDRMFDFLPSLTCGCHVSLMGTSPFLPPPSLVTTVVNVSTLANVPHHMADTGARCLGLPILPTHAGAWYLRASTVVSLLRCRCTA